MEYDLVILDAGHGGKDPGAVSGGEREKDNVLRWVLLLGSILESRGVPVAYTRTGDVYHSPAEKARIANAVGTTRSLFLSFHNNSFEKESGEGFENFVHPSADTDAIYLARELAMGCVNEFPVLGPLRVGASGIAGVKKKSFTVLSNTKMSAILLEIGFISNGPERVFISSEKNDAPLVGLIADILMKGCYCPEQKMEFEVVTTDESDDEEDLTLAGGLRLALLEDLGKLEWQAKRIREKLEG